MTDRPILFSAPMVRALLEGRKTQTRRALDLPSWTKGMDCTGRLYMYERQEGHERHGLEFLPHGRTLWHPQYNPRGSSGAYLRVPIMSRDRLWVREHWKTDRAYDDLPPRDMGGEEPLIYLADKSVQRWGWEPDAMSIWGRHRQAMHMPRWASRLTLTVTDVRVQRLQDISEDDAKAEGPCQHKEWPDDYYTTWKGAFAALWGSLNANRAPWDSNPWVVAYSFEVAHANIDEATS